MTSLDLRVYIEDTDAGGIVYHANYLNYLERGRTEWLRTKGFDQNSLLERNIALVVRRLECQYRLPAKLDDLLNIETVAGTPRHCTVAFEQRVMRDGKLLFRGMVDIACIDATRYKPVRWPEDLLSAMTLDSQNA
ncbi:tol-pal system-associated acyl-CoA thioesterase [Kushneria marisflavi]|uniref:Tol-pal system-associated acyl-CoA thioesterase n=1 Tax=Kushneria marisflavi TaxID=157779 RepID=A0A240UKM4_9GAMM|nr:tol-pal system-associated acyl-CoA thioesterase [Kushneria marisflavi]ART61665.1 tol-pal system-associated acyl-CoA thioesterase [Kushneria marisflavi]RKD86678.1 4-hydroxybenzoyl-CoA thioesterase/acyl-CoA thioester hydrolase [Kushneria marisflavi]